MRMKFVGLLALAVGSWLVGPAMAAEWGDLVLSFKYDGKAPPAKAANVNKDVEVCGKHMVKDEELLVNADNGGLSNVVVWLYLEKGAKKPAIHESYSEDEKAEVNFDNEKCRFEPHIRVVRTSQTLLIGNKDTIGHNTNIAASANPPSNTLVPANGKLKQNMKSEERLPAPVSCNIHPWMKGYLVVKDTPYVGVSDQDGKLVIKNLPAGKHTFVAWHEKAGYLSKVTLDGKAASWSKGRFDVTVKAGENDMGEAKVKPDAFK